MASACVNNITMSPDKFPPATYPSYGWLSPRISFSREEDTSSKQPGSSKIDPQAEDPLDPVDFEFRLDDPVTMLPADELFSDGKLVPLQVNNIKAAVNSGLSEMRSPETTTAKSCRSRIMEMEISGTDPYLFSPKAPRCSSRWKELLGLKKLYQNANSSKAENHKTASLSSSNPNPNPKSLKHFLHRSSKSCSCNSSSTSDHSLSLPLLKDSDCESVSISSSRLSLSSSSSGHDHEDLPRLSLDSEKPNPNTNPNPNPFVLNRNPNQNPPRMRMVKPRSEINNANGNSSNNPAAGNRVGRSPMRRSAEDQSSRGVSVDSPRMNSSGKIVFQSLERSSSSPSSFNGGPRFKHRGMERSYSANVRVTPVLNVPVCSLRGTSKSFGFGQLFSSSPQKRESSNKAQLQQQHSNSRNRT
ncbi:homeobox protein 9 [Ricinus communis]|uniref:Uncharacterized protein n=1 Tax=Ricinus communis TaxID=3988 RepID=B9RI60_RICCO|nr:homeobox protein 9 [Ricinus communis]EEF48832.1 conserved hypothetical protein [Ricinus communis]|eukprot:XP_002513429.1 homeobox protein 9 [Ricinus communis]